MGGTGTAIKPPQSRPNGAFFGRPYIEKAIFFGGGRHDDPGLSIIKGLVSIGLSLYRI